MIVNLAAQLFKSSPAYGFDSQKHVKMNNFLSYGVEILTSYLTLYRAYRSSVAYGFGLQKQK